MPALKGVGLIKGLGVTLRTMTRPAATRQYPHVRPQLPARTRGVIALIEENCTVCMLCSRECPDWCIYIDSHKEQVAAKEGGRARTRNILDRFAIDFALCMYCGICVEVCPFDALHWSPEFEYAEYQVERLTHEMDTLRTWAYSVPAPDPLEEGAVEPKELETARKAREAVAAKAAAAAEQAQAAVPAAAPTAAPPAAAPTAGAAGGAPASAAGASPPAGVVVGAPASAGGAGAGAAPAAARPADVEVEPGIDQATYERLLAAGEPDRTARAKAKAAYMRKAKAEARAAQAAGAAPAPAPPAEAGAPTTTPAGMEGAPGEMGRAAPAAGEGARAAEAGSVETPVAAVSAPETAPPAPSAAGTPEAAEPSADARDPDARSPEGDPTAAGTAVDVAPGAQAAQADAEHLEIEVDQETYDRLIAAGEPERTARAKAKAAYARKLRAAQRGGGTGAGS
jgi:formate hydrogenlyase subunit 6/NADH:ubiquinone oxidoreductase subunit I